MDPHEEASEKQGLPLDQVAARARQNAPLVAASMVAIAASVLVIVALVSSWPIWLVIVLAGLVVAAAVAVGGTLRSAAAWDNPQLFLPSNDDLHLGDHVVVRFRREAGGLMDTSGAAVSAEVFVDERARSADGSGEQRHRVYRNEVPAVLHGAADNTIEADLAIDIPLYDAPPTMDLGHHEIVWSLEVTIDAPHAPNDTSTFPLLVAPTVARRLVDGGVGR